MEICLKKISANLYFSLRTKPRRSLCVHRPLVNALMFYSLFLTLFSVKKEDYFPAFGELKFQFQIRKQVSMYCICFKVKYIGQLFHWRVKILTRGLFV
jgi:hypothetical protein